MEKQTTRSAFSLVADWPKPEQPVDLDAIGADYLAKAKSDAAKAYFDFACPSVFRESDWSHPNLKASQTAIASLLAWDSASTKGIIASGLTGRGKTRAMWGLAKRLACDEGKEVQFWTACDWFARLQRNLSYGRDEAQGWVEACAKRPIVFIDDLGQEAVTSAREEWAQAWFFRFLDIRVGKGLPLFITTNLTAEQIAGTARNEVRANPLIRRLLDLANPIKF